MLVEVESDEREKRFHGGEEDGISPVLVQAEREIAYQALKIDTAIMR